MAATKQAEYLRAHRSLDAPFPFAFPVPYYDTIHALGADVDYPKSHKYEAPLSTDASASLDGLRYTEENLTYNFENAEVEISLSPLGTDDLLLPASLLVQHSPWFLASLSNRWKDSGKCRGNLEPENKIRYELIFEEEGGSYLLRKNAPTPWLDRLNADNATLFAFATARDGRPETMDTNLDSQYYGMRDTLEHWPCDSLRRAIIDSYKIGFALMLGIPLRLENQRKYPDGRYNANENDDEVKCYRWDDIDDLPELIAPRRSWTVVLLKLVEFAEFFSTGLSMNEAIGHVAMQQLVVQSIYQSELTSCPGQILRIAVAIRSKALFREACIFACSRHDEMEVLDGIGNDPLLQSTVLKCHLQLRYAVEKVMGNLHCPQEYCRWDEGDCLPNGEPEVFAYEAWGASLVRAESKERGSDISQTWYARSRHIRNVLEELLEGKLSSIKIVNRFMAHEKDLPATIDRGPIYVIVDGIIADAIQWAKTILNVDGPGYLEGDWRLNGVDFASDVFTYPWEVETDSDADKICGPRLDVFCEHSLGDNNVVAKPEFSKRGEWQWVYPGRPDDHELGREGRSRTLGGCVWRDLNS